MRHYQLVANILEEIGVHTIGPRGLIGMRLIQSRLNLLFSISYTYPLIHVFGNLEYGMIYNKFDIARI